jgi:hypothetical protein
MMRKVLKWAALVLSGAAVLAVAAYAYYWYSPSPQVPTLSSAIQRELKLGGLSPQFRELRDMDYPLQRRHLECPESRRCRHQSRSASQRERLQG